MVRAEVIRKRLNRLDEYISILHRLQSHSAEAFIEEPELYGSAERFLQLAIEAVTDMGNHVIADEGLGTVNSYSDVPTILAGNGYIDDRLKEEWIRMIGFRNILVHEYTDIDRRIVYDAVHHRLGALEELQRMFAQFL